MYKFLPHTADIQFVVSSKTLEGLFSESALAMKKAICDSKISEKIHKKIKIKGHDLINLLYNFLEEILFIMDTENLIFSKVKKIKFKNEGMLAEIDFDEIEKYETYLEIKAITYNEMYVEKKNGFWEAKVTIDV